MKHEEEIRYELNRLERIVYDPMSEKQYDHTSLMQLYARWNALKWVLGVE